MSKRCVFKANGSDDEPPAAPAMPVQMVFSQFLAGRLHFGGRLLTLIHSKPQNSQSKHVKTFYLLETTVYEM